MLNMVHVNINRNITRKICKQFNVAVADSNSTHVEAESMPSFMIYKASKMICEIIEKRQYDNYIITVTLIMIWREQ